MQDLQDLCTIFPQYLLIFAQYLYSICIIFAQSIYDIFTIYKQYSHNILYNINTKLFYNIWTIVVQHLPRSCLIFAQYLYNIWTILIQYLHNICKIFFFSQYLSNNYTIFEKNFLLRNLLHKFVLVSISNMDETWHTSSTFKADEDKNSSGHFWLILGPKIAHFCPQKLHFMLIVNN